MRVYVQADEEYPVYSISWDIESIAWEAFIDVPTVTYDRWRAAIENWRAVQEEIAAQVKQAAFLQ